MNGFLGRPPVKGGSELASGGLVFAKIKTPRSQKPLASPLDRGAAEIQP